MIGYWLAAVVMAAAGWVMAPGDAQHKTYLPIVQTYRMMVGAQDESLFYAGSLPAGSVYKISVRWDEVEVAPGVYQWQAGMDEAVRLARARGLRVLIGTRASPLWVRYKPDWVCSQPKREYYGDYARFIQAVVDKYDPWGVEVWNEPDVHFSQVSQDWAIMGCFETAQDYADLVSEVDRQLDGSGVMVLAGALMLDSERGYTFAKYLRDRGDYLSFHAYAYSGMQQEMVIYDKLLRLRNSLGLNSLMFVTETALLQNQSDCTGSFEAEKRVYADWVNLHDYEWGLVGRVWYTAGGNNWLCSDLTAISGEVWW